MDNPIKSVSACIEKGGIITVLNSRELILEAIDKYLFLFPAGKKPEGSLVLKATDVADKTITLIMSNGALQSLDANFITGTMFVNIIKSI